MTDKEIYELHPEIEALNAEYVAHGATLKDLEPKLVAAHQAVLDAEAKAKSERDAAQAALAAVNADHTAKVNAAKLALDRLRRQIQETQQKQQQVQADHNAALADAHAAETAKAAVTPAGVTSEDSAAS